MLQCMGRGAGRSLEQAGNHGGLPRMHEELQGSTWGGGRGEGQEEALSRETTGACSACMGSVSM